MRWASWWLAVALVSASVGAQGRLPPCKPDSEFLAAGGVIFTGQVIALGPERGPLKGHEWVDLKIQDDPGRRLAPTERILPPDAGLYTPPFTMGEIHTIRAVRVAGGLAMVLCFRPRS